MVILKILEKKHEEYLIFDKMFQIIGITDDAPEETKEAYQEFLEFQKYCKESNFDF